MFDNFATHAGLVYDVTDTDSSQSLCPVFTDSSQALCPVFTDSSQAVRPVFTDSSQALFPVLNKNGFCLMPLHTCVAESAWKVGLEKDVPYISGTLGDTGVQRHKTEPIFIQHRTKSFDLETRSTNKHTNIQIYMLASEWIVTNLKQNEPQRTHARWELP